MRDKINRKIRALITVCCYKRMFGHIGKNSIIIKPLQLNKAKGIFIANNVSVFHNAWLMCISSKKKTMLIMEGTTIGHYAHIVAMNSVVVERNVLIADKVFISDCTHIYDDINVSVAQQDIRFLAPVIIGEGSWLGENVCVYGASIGKHCIIGANSVVNENIPDYCVAVGAPAKVIKKYDFEKNKWVRV